MAKVNFNKINLKKNTDTITVNFNDTDIEILQYLPIQDKLELLTNVINQAIASSGKYYNPGQISLIFKMELIYAYTNITFTPKQKEEFTKTFDLMESTGFMKTILNAIPQTEVSCLEAWLLESVKSVYDYIGSARAILDTLQDDFSNSQSDLTDMQEQLKNPETLKLLKEIIPLMGLDQI